MKREKFTKLVVSHQLVFPRWGLSLALSLCQPLQFSQLQGTPQHNLWQLGTAFVLCSGLCSGQANKPTSTQTSGWKQLAGESKCRARIWNFPWAVSLPPAIFSLRDCPNLMWFVWLAIKWVFLPSISTFSLQAMLTSASTDKVFCRSAVQCAKNHPILFVGGDCFKAHVKQK